MSVKELVKRAIDKYNMPDTDTKILVGFSGGSDSVCLISVLCELGYNVTACHLNHNMRDTSMRDMLFCEEFCKERNIPFISKIADKHSIKSEADARAVRYAFFEEAMADTGIEVVATAHNKNDSAETVLLNLLRGSALDGLCGILAKDKKVIRPLILTSKKEVLEYVRANNLSYMTDETNLTDIYTRNKLRNKIIPLLEENFNPRLTENLAENAELMSYDREYLKEMTEKAYDEVLENDGLSCLKLTKLPRALSGRVLQLKWQWVTGSGQNLQHKFIEKILLLAENAKTASKIDLPDGFEARVEYGKLKLAKRVETVDFCEMLEIEKYVYLSPIGIKAGVFAQGKGLPVSLDGDEVLQIRSKRTGDSFYPAGLSGRKTVSDYFTDKKLPHDLRAKTPILTADGKIAAVGNMRADQDFCVGKKKKNYYFIVEEI